MTSPHLHAVDARDANAAAPAATRPIPEIIAELKAGRIAVLVDEEDRENEGDLIVAADCVTPEIINFMAKHGRGLVCMPITEARARQLNLAPMTPVNRSVHGTNFTVSIVDLIHYRSQTERLIERVGERPIRTAEGDFHLVTFRDKLTDATHLALTRGQIAPERETLVRVHEPLSVVDLLDYGSRTHSWTIPAALAAIARAECGVLVLLHRPESAQELRQRAVADQPAAETRMDLRNYGIGAQILRDLNVGKMRLLARPRKMPSMAGFGLEVTGYDDLSAAGPASPR